jgi:hypothetical protein
VKKPGAPFHHAAASISYVLAEGESGLRTATTLWYPAQTKEANVDGERAAVRGKSVSEPHHVQPVPPEWVTELVGPNLPLRDLRPNHETSEDPSIEVKLLDDGQYVLVSTCLLNASQMPAPVLRSAVPRVYRRIQETISRTFARYPVRLWNFIPGIHRPMGEGLTRYMVFNAGRYDAFCHWFSGSSRFSRSLPTSTGVGIEGDDLFVHCLAAPQPGQPEENVRQRPAYRYSRKYGPFPPCFARATRVRMQVSSLLLIGGTASVRGEDSAHIGNIELQLEETCLNLEALVAATVTGAENGGADSSGASVKELRRRIRELRVYYVRPEQADFIRSALANRFTGLRRLEMMRAELCRPELLVEIEAVAVLEDDERGNTPG